MEQAGNSSLLEPFQSRKDLGFSLELRQRAKLRPDIPPTQLASLPGQNAFDIYPILGPVSEGLEDDQVLRAASEQRDLWKDR
jgi:hypothetical protein